MTFFGKNLLTIFNSGFFLVFCVFLLFSSGGFLLVFLTDIIQASAAKEASTCSGASCPNFNEQCIRCNFPEDCKYGDLTEVTCTSSCDGSKSTFKAKALCRYCYQTDPLEHTCLPFSSASECQKTLPTSPYPRFKTKCTVKDTVVCMGDRKFDKYVPCHYTKGYKWSTALLLSITMGGFGVDRFYLGLWRSGLGKLFSFGGLGVWTIVDVILIATGYVGPADNSVYMY